MTQKLSNQEKFDLGYKAIFLNPTNPNPKIAYLSNKPTLRIPALRSA